MYRPSSLALIALVVLVGGAFSGCGSLAPADPSVRLTTDRAAYSAQDTLTLRLSNGTSAPVQHGNLGCVTLEARAESGWIEPPSTRACTMEIRSTGAGETATARFPIATFPLAPGTYRFRFSTSDPMRVLTTTPFTVGP